MATDMPRYRARLLATVPVFASVSEALVRARGAAPEAMVRRTSAASARLCAGSVSRRCAEASMLSSRTPRLTYEGTSGRLVWQSPAPGGAAATAGSRR